jgi:tetratricopeptide (TPR) repeat protein
MNAELLNRESLGNSKQDAAMISSADKWSRAETIAKITSLIAIPVILGVVGWLVQEQVATLTVAKDYVQLAVSILSQPKQPDVDPTLRSWAVQLLNQNSPVKFSSDIAAQLTSGKATLPQERYDNLVDLARTFMTLGQYPKAEIVLEETLEQQRQALGGEHPAVAKTLTELGKLYLDEGALDKAKAVLSNALEISVKTSGPDDLSSARIMSSLASVYFALGDYEEAKALRQRAELIYGRAIMPQK